jgi:Ni/Fe-hydrogenase subunit HybB-like protein
MPDPTQPLIPEQSFRDVTEQLTAITLEPPPALRWFIAGSALLVGVFLVSVVVLFTRGVGIWGVNQPVGWGLDILNTVWWIGIAHAGTMISALLLLVGHGFRNSLNRFAEAMAVFAAICAALYPILHLGRPEVFYWVFPYPSPLGLWPQFRSPLTWDVIAFATYLTVSILFWYVGLIPDLASVRDRSRSRSARRFYGLLALGWRGSARHWLRWRQVYRLIAALAIVLVVLLHSAGAMLFAIGPVPGWHSTLFPAFFMFGAVFSGFAMVAIIAVLLRGAFHLHNLVTDRHLDILGMLLLSLGLLTAYGYVMEAFFPWYSGDPYELQTLHDRLAGPYAWSTWGSLLLAMVPIQALWWRRVRASGVGLLVVAVLVTVGMWLERFMLLVTSSHRDFLPSAWGFYTPSFWEWSLFVGTVGLFLFLFFLFVRFLPLVSIFEIKEVLQEERSEVT